MGRVTESPPRCRRESDPPRGPRGRRWAQRRRVSRTSAPRPTAVCGRLPDCKPFLRFVVLPSAPLKSAEPIRRDNGAALRPSRALPLKDGQPSGWPSRTSRTAGRGSHPEGRSGAEDPRERVDGRGWPCATLRSSGWSGACGQVQSCVRPQRMRVSHAPRACMEIRGSGPNRLSVLRGTRLIAGSPDPVSLTVCPYHPPTCSLPRRRRQRLLTSQAVGCGAR